MDHAFQEAVRSNPDVRQTTFQTESVGYARDVAFASDLPSLSLVASGGYTAGDRPDLFNSDSKFYKIGLNLTIPLFSGLSSIAKGHNYDEQLIQAQKNEDIERNTIRQGIQDALTSVHSAESQLRFAREGVQQAIQALALANEGYKLGTASNTDVITLQATRYSAEKLLLTSEYNYLQALLTLRQTMGIDLEKAYAKS
jgi:outer membrane protein TolC